MNLESPAPDDAPKYHVGYQKPSKEHHFKTGNTANLKGRPRRKKSSLLETFAERLNQEIKVPRKKRVRMTMLQALIRGLIQKAAAGDEKSLSTLIWLSEFKTVETPNAVQDWIVFTFSDVIGIGSTKRYDEQYFRNQDKALAEWHKLAKAGGSIQGIVEKELDRKIPQINSEGKKKNVPIRELIVARFIKAAADDGSILKTLLRIIPEKKFKAKFQGPEILRPTRADYEKLGARVPAWAPPPSD